jgi:site-specific DNA recombinase
MTDLAAIYVRVSTEEQASQDKTSLDQQRERCVAYCHAQGWEVFEVYPDPGVSGTLDPEHRHAMHKLLEDAAAGRFQRLVFLKVDRVARSLRKLLNFSHQLQGLGIGLVSVVEQFDTSTASGQLYFNLLGAFAEFERATINERMSDGRKGAVRNGRYMASITPFGYVRENGTLTPHPEQADLVRQMFQWAREGLGVKVIVRRLTEQGVEPPSPPNRKSFRWGWYHTTVYKTLTSPRYIGKATYAGEPMPCPPLVDEETFNAVQEGLRKRRRDSPRNTKNLYLLQHLLWCRHCGGRYMAKTVSHGAVYLCRQRTVYGKKADHEGLQWRWHAGELETAIKKHVLRVLVKPDYLVHDAQVYREAVDQRINEQRVQGDRLRAQLTSLQQQEARVQDGWLKGIFGDEQQLQGKLADLRNQQQQIRARLEVLAAESPVEELTKAEKVRYIADYVTLMHAHAGNWRRGLPGFRPTKKGWEDDALAALAQQTHIEVPLSWDDEQEWQTESVPVDQWWRDTITTLVDEIWVEDDGKWLTVKGTIKVASGKVKVGVSDITPSR